MSLCKIIYATQSGTALEVAEQLSRDLIRNGILNRVEDVESYDYKKYMPHEKLLLFVVSTQGHGEVPDSMKNMWRFLLRTDLPGNALIKVKFATLGLGDSSYTTYNFASKKLTKRLESLGAQQIVRRGDADDQHELGIDFEVEKWTLEVIEKLHQLYPLPLDFKPIDRTILQPSKYIIKEQIENIRNDKVIEFKPTSQYSTAILKENIRLTCPHWSQDIRHLDLDLATSAPDVKYQPGDVAYILPENPDKQVDEIIKYLGYNPDQIIIEIISSNNDIYSNPSIQLPTTIKILFKNYFDIMGSPRRYFFEMLQHFVEDADVKERLQYFSSKEGQEDLRDYNQKEKRNYLDVLRDFPGLKIPFPYIFDLITPIRPRPFSISSANAMFPHSIHITSAIHTFQLPTRRLVRKGLCSQWFEILKPNTPIPFYIKESGANMPSKLTTPMIMVGPGTGCAMFRSYMQYREIKRSIDNQNNNNDNNNHIGKSIFYFGCRHANSDYIYQEEFEKYQEVGTIAHLRVAFSQDSDDGKKVYVQHLMRQDSKLIWSLIHQEEAHFYISGSSGRMPKDVKLALTDIIRENLQIDPQNQGLDSDKLDELTSEYMEKLEKEKRYQTEVW